jgi:hypothetical protein
MPPEGEVLENRSARITRAWVFKKLVGVREAEVGERLGLVFQGNRKAVPYRRVAVGKAY